MHTSSLFLSLSLSLPPSLSAPSSSLPPSLLSAGMPIMCVGKPLLIESELQVKCVVSAWPCHAARGEAQLLSFHSSSFLSTRLGRRVQVSPSLAQVLSSYTEDGGRWLRGLLTAARRLLAA